MKDFTLFHAIRKGDLIQITEAQEVRSASDNADIRDTNATDLFTKIVESYKNKISVNKGLKIVLFVVSLIILLALVFAFCGCLYLVINKQNDISTIL